MKRISFFLIAFALCAAPGSRAQDAATEERLNKLNGLVQDLVAAQAEQQKRVAALAGELKSMREEQGKPNTSYANQEDLRRLAEKIQEIDKKREADKELILKEISKLGKTIVAAPPKKPADITPAGSPAADGPAGSGSGYWQVIGQGDTLSTIAQAYREKNIKVTADQIQKANPGLDAKKLKVGQKIWIPAPTQP